MANTCGLTSSARFLVRDAEMKMHSTIVPARFARHRLLATLLAGSLLLAATVPGAARADAQQVSEAVFKKYDPAHEAYQKKDYATALRLGGDALTVARTPFEKSVCLKLIMSSAIQTKSYPQAVQAIEELLALEGSGS